MQSLCLMVVLVGVVMGGPVSPHPNIDSPALLSSTVDDLGRTRTLAGDENPTLRDVNQALGDVNQATGDSDLALGDTGLFGDTGLDLGDNRLALADMEEIYFDDELVPLVLLIPRNLLNNLHHMDCGEDCDPDTSFPGQTGTPVVTRKKRGFFGAIAAAVRTGTRATATGLRTAARATATGLRTVARKTATARRVLGKVATQVERGTLLYFVIDQANQLARLQQEVLVLRQQYANATSRPEKERIVDELMDKREEAVNILDSIDQITRELEEANNS